MFYLIFFRLFINLLGKFFIRYAVSDFCGTILLCGYYTFVVLLMVIYLLRQNGRAFFKVSFSSRYVGMVMLLALGNIALSAVLAYYLPLPLNQKLLNENQLMISSDIFWVRFFWGGIIALISEELFYRGILMSTYFKNSRYYLDVLLSAICFASVHVIWLSWSWTDFLQYIPAGLSLGVTFKWTKSIYYPILLHFLVNYGPKIIFIILN